MTNEHSYFRQLLRKPGVTIALIGATNDHTKYGNIIFKNLRSKGYTVFPVNPRAQHVDDIPAFHTLADLPQPADILNFVLPPKLGIEILKAALEQDLDNFWFQPGAESPEIIALLQNSGKHFLADGSCIMVMSL